MRRFVPLMLITLMLTLVLGGCREDPSTALAFQDRECRFTATCALSDGSYVVEVVHYPDHSGEIAFLSPDSLKGCKYLRTSGGEYSFQAADTLFPVEKNPTTEAIFSLFFLCEDDLLSAKLTENSGERLNVLTFQDCASGQQVTLYLSRDGMPLYYQHPLITLTVHAKSTEE